MVTLNAGADVEEPDNTYVAGGNVKWDSCSGHLSQRNENYAYVETYTSQPQTGNHQMSSTGERSNQLQYIQTKEKNQSINTHINTDAPYMLWKRSHSTATPERWLQLAGSVEGAPGAPGWGWGLSGDGLEEARSCNGEGS